MVADSRPPKAQSLPLTSQNIGTLCWQSTNKSIPNTSQREPDADPSGPRQLGPKTASLSQHKTSVIRVTTRPRGCAATRHTADRWFPTGKKLNKISAIARCKFTENLRATWDTRVHQCPSESRRVEHAQPPEPHGGVWHATSVNKLRVPYCRAWLECAPRPPPFNTSSKPAAAARHGAALCFPAGPLRHPRGSNGSHGVLCGHMGLWCSRVPL